jgi:catechol 2,3-dioxygenase-like lactoylglutathione lyase family enzyme
MSLEIRETIPILRIFSVEKAREFYLDFLGFRVDWEHRFEPSLPLYMQVSKGNCLLHLSEHYGDACPGSTVFIRVTGLEEFQRQLIAQKYNYLRPGIDCSFPGAKTMEVIDPFGNRLRFWEDVKPAT